MKLVRNAGLHHWGALDDGLRYCELCGYAEAAVAVGPYRKQCSGIKGILGRPAVEDLTGRDDARLSAASGPSLTGSPPAAPRPVKKRHAISPASPAQRSAVRGRACIVTADDRQVDPAHLIPRGVTTVGQDDPRAVVPLRRDKHRLYDDGDLDLLPYLEPHFRVELAFAVERVGLVATLRQVTGRRWTTEGAA